MFIVFFLRKERAMAASFISRFAIGFIIFNMDLGIPGWLKGGIVGFVLSLPGAIVIKKYPPILVVGNIGGLMCGLLVSL